MFIPEVKTTDRIRHPAHTLDLSISLKLETAEGFKSIGVQKFQILEGENGKRRGEMTKGKGTIRYVGSRNRQTTMYFFFT